VLKEIDKTIQMSSTNSGTRLCLAVNYGGRSEMVDAVQRIARDVAAGKFPATDVDETTISSYLYTSGMPDPDLLIRTAGEMRVSNFLLWQISYAELWVTPKCWPEFQVEDLHKAMREFAQRDRRYGGLNA
jgi:undecaprenyl diphosphate synthase